MKNTIIYVIFSAFLFILLLGIGLFGQRSQREQREKQYNNGICINCGEKLKAVGVEDHYNRVIWACDKCGYYCIY